VKITCDPAKRARTLETRGFDFDHCVDDHCVDVFAGDTIDEPDERRDYGEPRIRTIGWLRGRMVVVVRTSRGASFR